MFCRLGAGIVTGAWPSWSGSLTTWISSVGSVSLEARTGGLDHTPSCFSVLVLVTQSCLTLCSPMDYSYGIFQARILEWALISFSRGSSWPRDWTQVSCIVGRFFTIWATREAPVLVGRDKPKEANVHRLFLEKLLLTTCWWLSSV